MNLCGKHFAIRICFNISFPFQDSFFNYSHTILIINILQYIRVKSILYYIFVLCLKRHILIPKI